MRRLGLGIACSLLLACGARSETAHPASAASATSATPEAAPVAAASPEEAPTEVAPPPSVSCGPLDAPRAIDDPVATFRQARAAYEAEQLLEAADLAEAVARGFPQHELAFPAAEISLDALNRVAGGPAQRGACVARIGRLAVDYAALFGCTARGPHDDRCDLLERLRCDSLRASAELLVQRDELAEASLAYERVHTTGCATHADEALYNAAVCARRAGDGVRADTLAAELARAYPQSPVRSAPAP